MTICEGAVSFAGEAITAGGIMKTRNEIMDCAYTIGAGFDQPWIAIFLNQWRSLVRRIKEKQRGVVEALRVETWHFIGTLVGERKCVGRIPDVHQLVDKRQIPATLPIGVIRTQIRIHGVVHPRVVVCDALNVGQVDIDLGFR